MDRNPIQDTSLSEEKRKTLRRELEAIDHFAWSMKLRLIHHAKNEGRAWDSKHLDDHTTEEEEEKLRTGGFDTPMRYSIDRALAMYLLWKLLTDPQEG